MRHTNGPWEFDNIGFFNVDPLHVEEGMLTEFVSSIGLYSVKFSSKVLSKTPQPANRQAIETIT
eukprot:756482-Hanusia_phi.AAC.5